MFCLHIDLAAHHWCAQHPQRPKRASELLELELQKAISWYVGAGLWTHVLGKNSLCSWLQSHLSIQMSFILNLEFIKDLTQSCNSSGIDQRRQNPNNKNNLWWDYDIIPQKPPKFMILNKVLHVGEHMWTTWTLGLSPSSFIFNFHPNVHPKQLLHSSFHMQGDQPGLIDC